MILTNLGNNYKYLSILLLVGYNNIKGYVRIEIIKLGMWNYFHIDV